MMHNQVYILSDAIRTGKTTTLQKWVEQTPNVSGFLSPDIDGKRMFQNIETGSIIAMEIEHKGLTVGKYTFDSRSFEYVGEKILEVWEVGEVNYIVIDEIGPLEIKKDLGFHNLLTKLQANTNGKRPNLLLVVRDYCLESFLEKYSFKNVKVMSLKEFKSSFNL